MDGSSSYIVTIVTSTATYRQNFGEGAIKMKTETIIRMQEIAASVGYVIDMKMRPEGC